MQFIQVFSVVVIHYSGRNGEFLSYQNINSINSHSTGAISKVEHYEDFETIDWVKDVSRDRCRHRELHLNRVSLSFPLYLSLLPIFFRVFIVNLTNV